MIFGRSLFGGAVIAGYITVSGAATATATAVAEAHVSYNLSGYGVATATVPPANGFKVTFGHGEAACSATVTGIEHVDFMLKGDAFAEATATGFALLESNPKVNALATAVATGVASKRVRMPYQTPANAYAYAEGDGISYVLATANPARAYAYGFGTTYYVGRGNAVAEASIEAVPEIIIGASNNATGTAEASGECLRIAGANAKGLATATIFGDGDKTHNGIRYVEFFGKGVAKATLTNSTTIIFQPQQAHAYAYINAIPVHTKGVKGKATGTATLVGNAVLVQTAVEASPANVTATLKGKAFKTTLSKASALAVAVGNGNLKASFLLKGKGTGYATATISGLSISVRAKQTMLAEATASGNSFRTRLVKGNAYGIATVTGFLQINDFDRTPDERTVFVLSEDRIVYVYEEDRTVIVV